MRQKQKQKMLEVIKSLEEAHDKIKDALQKGGDDQAKIMLGECQELAVSLGESIESLEGEGHVTVAKIEDYCECLYQLYAELAEGSSSLSEGKIYKILKKQLIVVENSVKNDIVIKKEIVFLPHMASMWDAMESIWMAARDDESCNAFVVAIPYYERNADESLGKMHYEGNEYPEYVPITDWQTYDLAERRPDIIYTQNLYDEWNQITCVHPQYFSGELKKYTDMLVYIPYFVGINDHVQEYFCVTPTVMNADRVIVQSEEVKRIYIENIRKFEEEYNKKGLFGNLEKKILPLGSPKFDRIRRVMESGEIKVPEEWKDKVYGPDGKKKKIILYNTTINTLLNHSDTYIDKLRSVLALFREKENILLLWRPHPLFESAIRSMRSELCQEYMKIVERYQEEGWGIYDRSADLDRAVILSDAYYGDMSSVVELYKATGKPIMIQNCEVGTEHGAD